MNEDLHNLYRPTTFKELIGQEAIKKSIEGLFKQKKMPHAFLFHGPAGTGKTTMARIIANVLEVEKNNYIEVDAASYSGADSTRDLVKIAQYKGLGRNPNRLIVIDEIHSLSKQAFQVLLKPLEEPIPNVYYVLCTTELNKVPKTIQTRCHTYAFTEASKDDLLELLEQVSEEEEIELDDKTLRLIAAESHGSYRQALVYLSACRNVEDSKEAEEVLQTVSEGKQIIDLCRYLMDSKSDLKGALELLRNIVKDDSVQAESIRLMIVNYMAKVAINNPRNMQHILNILSAFSVPCNSSEKMAPIILSLSEVFS